MSSSTQLVKNLQEATWKGSLPLEIVLSPGDSRVYDKSDPYYIHFPRLSYLPFLLERLHRFFEDDLIDPVVPASSAWFSFEGVPLKWHHPVGLLYDLFAGAVPAVAAGQFTSPQSKQSSASSPLPWRLMVHYSSFPSDQLVQLDSEGKAVHDAYINSVKEADFLRNGTANAIMKLNIEDSTALWRAVVDHNLEQFAPIYNRLVPASSSLRHIPLRIYLPASDITSREVSPSREQTPSSPTVQAQAGHLRVVQSLVQPFVAGTREQQTMGMALNGMLPALFPSQRRMVLARPVLHGAVVPLEAVLEDLMRGAVYADGWLNLGIEMII